MDDKRLGVVVIGQAPRGDTEAALRRVLGSGIDIELRGALDGMRRAEVERHSPKDSEDTLFTLLADGKPVVVGKHLVEERAAGQLERFQREGVSVTLLYCTGRFQLIEGLRSVVFPSAVLTHLVEALCPQGKLGIFTPLAEQEKQVRGKWAESGLEVVCEPLVPTADGPEVEAAARRMAPHRADLLVMDCMGYTHAQKEIVRRICGTRAVLAASAAARAVQELID
jgi:protein AroM